MKFTATGEYVGITDFIYDIENDSSLGFKIEEFKLLPATTQQSDGKTNLSATFTCKNIAINIDPSAIAKPEQNENTEGQTQGENSTTDGNNTNSVNSTNTTNNTTVTNTTR